MKSWLILVSLLLLAAGAAHAQATGPLSIGSKFVAGDCLDAKSDATLVINACTAQASQALTIDDNTGLVHQGDSQCLAVVAKGQALALLPCADVPEQRWTFEDDGTLKADSGLCADVLNFWRDPGTPVIAWDCNATDNQKFFATHITLAAGATPPAAGTAATLTGTPAIASYFVPGLCMDVSGKQASVAIRTCDRKPNQAFHFASGNSGHISQGDQCLASANKGEPLVVVACSAAPEQDWLFTVDGTLRNRANLCADIFKFGTRPGTDVIAWDCTGTDNQKWYPALAAASGSFAAGPSAANALQGGGQVTTLSLAPGWSARNLTGAGGLTIAVDSSGNITGGEGGTIVVGGAGVLTVRFPKGLAAASVTDAAKAGGTDLLPADWAFFSGDTAGHASPGQ